MADPPDGADTPAPPPSTGPVLVAQLAGFATLIAFATLDAWSVHWNPDPWSYIVGIVAAMWGPGIIPAWLRRP